MNTRKDAINPLKQALERSMAPGLSSNFNYRMMERIRLEAEKRRKRKAFITTLSLMTATLSLLMLGVYVIFFYLELDLMEYLPEWRMQRLDLGAIGFYSYLGALVLLLLGMDHWLRSRQRKSSD